jgi:anti-sigma B factor antagonist
MSKGLMDDNADDSAPLRCRVEADGEHVVVTVSGEVDFHTASLLDRAVEKSTHISPRLVVDLTDVSFIDSTGLGVLIGARSRAQESGGSIAIVHPPHTVVRLLSSSRMQQTFPVYASVDEALGRR